MRDGSAQASADEPMMGRSQGESGTPGVEESKRTQSSAVSSTGTPADVGLESEVHLSDFLAVVRRRWRVVLSVFTALFLLTAFVNFTKSPIYEGKATLRIGEDKVPFAFGKFDPFQEQPDPIHSEIEIMRSRTIAEEVVRTRNLQFALGKLPEGFELVLGEGSVRAERVETSGSFTLRFLDSHGRFEVFSGEGLSVSQGSVGWPFQGGDFSFVIESASPIEAGLEFDFAIVPFRAAAENLRTRLKVSPRGKTNVVTINVKAGSPEEAASTANEVARVYMQSTIERRTEQASRTKTFVETQLTTLRGRLENAEKELRNYKAEVGVMSLDQDTERIL
ncbi:MAG: Wzz/FepE/Etk N-terminal domain-containing protein, partial [Planctomycetota bacterium]